MRISKLIVKTRKFPRKKKSCLPKRSMLFFQWIPTGCHYYFIRAICFSASTQHNITLKSLLKMSKTKAIQLLRTIFILLMWQIVVSFIFFPVTKWNFIRSIWCYFEQLSSVVFGNFSNGSSWKIGRISELFFFCYCLISSYILYLLLWMVTHSLIFIFLAVCFISFEYSSSICLEGKK